MAQSFTMAITPGSVDEVRVGTQDPKAEWHHRGTRPYAIDPVRRKFLVFQTVQGPVFARHVDHPGLPARPLLPSRRLAGDLAGETLQGYLREVLRRAGLR